MNRIRIPLAFALALVAALSTTHVTAVAEQDSQEPKRHPAVVAADWSGVTEVVVELADNTFKPGDLTLKLGVPYLLRLKNVGGLAHDMVGGTFFEQDAIALRMINSRVGRVTADDISSVYVRPKNEIEIWFVPIKKGDFTFVCSIPGHRESGMEGSIRIVD